MSQDKQESQDVQEEGQKEDSEERVEKVLFGIPVDTKYTKLLYFMVLIASGFAVVSGLLAIVGIHLPGGFLFATVGLLALVLSLIALFVFEEAFNTVDRSHFLYISIAYAFFFVVGMFLNAVLGFLGFLGALIMFPFIILQAAAFFAGYQVWERDEQATRESLTAQLMTYKNIIMGKLSKAEKKAEEATEKVMEKAEEFEEKVEKKLEDVVEKKKEADDSNKNHNHNHSDSVDKSA